MSKKLYVVVGLMATLIATELFTLLFAMNTLSAVRAFVQGEGLWTKSQKNAIHSLYQYALSGEERYFVDFKKNLTIAEGDHQARIALLQRPPNLEAVRTGFIQGGNHPNDVDGMIKLLLRFHKISYISNAIVAWTNADVLLEDLRAEAEIMNEAILKEGRNSPKVRQALDWVSRINLDLNVEEGNFSSSLGAGSRWLEKMLMIILALTVLTIESTGILLTFRFSRTLSQSLKELMGTAEAVGRGDFSVSAKVHSKDELGQLSESINKMIRELRMSVSQKRHVDEILRKSEERFRLLVEAVDDYAIFILDPNGFVTTWNSGAERIKSYAADEIIGKHVSSFYTQEDVDAGVPARSLEIAKNEGRFERDALRVRKDGSTFWASIVTTPLYGRDRQLTGFSQVTRDISERKEAEVRLQRLNEELEIRVKERTRELQVRASQLRLITNALPVLVAELDSNERMLFANAAFCEWLEKPFEQMVGKTFREVLGDIRYAAHEPYLQKVTQGQLTTYERPSLSGHVSANYQITLVPEFDDSGKVEGTILVANDVTKYKEIEAELKRAKESADVANEAKSAFLANMSHEIRTPLGVILGFSEMMLSQEMSADERANSMEVIRRNGQLLSNVINDILDLSKVEAGKLEYEKVKVPFSEVTAEIESLLSLQATEKGLKLNVTADKSIPEMIQTDPLRLRQVLMNVIGNAIKFTDHGAISVRMGMSKNNKNKSMLTFEVEDTGKGISQEQAERLFAPFQQADASTTRKFGGTGLGLVLSRKLANALGGDVVLKSSIPGQGSTFMITIDPGDIGRAPIRLADHKRPEKPKSSVPQKDTDLSEFKILLVDDSPDNQVIVSHFLRRNGAFVETANNGQEGVEKAMSGDFGVVLMDLQMPLMDGYEAIKALRHQGYKKPVIALTAHAMKEERRRCLDSGFDDHLSKPINPEALVETISHYSL